MDTMPIWVRGLMRECCDVYPNNVKASAMQDLHFSPRFCERLGDRCGQRFNSYSQIAPELGRMKRVAVYVMQPAFETFVVNIFSKLPRNPRAGNIRIPRFWLVFN